MSEVKRQPPPTEEDKTLLDRIVKDALGQQARGEFLGAMVRGVRGDEPHYGHAIVVTDPNFAKITDDTELDEYYTRLAVVSSKITNVIGVAGNVTLDITPLCRPEA